MKKRKVIIDCDPGIDDSLAIMLALKSPEIEVIGITIVCGNSPVEMGFGNAKKILKQMNRRRIVKMRICAASHLVASSAVQCEIRL